MIDSIQSGDAAFSFSESGLNVVYLPIAGEKHTMSILKIESEDSLIEKREMLEGFSRIYSNYLLILNESQRDKLTSLLNRRTFEQKLTRMMQIQKSYKDDYDGAKERRRLTPNSFAWLAIIDIDKFKRINDTHGHIYGDEVILFLAHKMREFFRDNDLLFRMGGEEFVIVFEPMPYHTAEAALERFRATIEEQIFPQIDSITISIGFAKITEVDYPPAILDRADKALYYAKQNGRNRVDNYELLLENNLMEDSAIEESIDLF